MMKVSLLSLILLASTSAFAAVPSILPDGTYSTKCTQNRAQKFDKPDENQDSTDKLGITRSTDTFSGTTMYRTLSGTTFVTQETIQQAHAHSELYDISISHQVEKDLGGGVFEETGTVTDESTFSPGENSNVMITSNTTNWKRTFQVFNQNLEINLKVQTNKEPEANSHYENQITKQRDGSYVVTTYNRDSYHRDAKKEGDFTTPGTTILEDRTTCVYTPMKAKN